MKLAYDSAAFWQTHAAHASASLLAKHYPKPDGLSVAGWQSAINRAKAAHPSLPWLVVRRGAHVEEPAAWPAPVYDEPTAHGEYRTTTEVRADGSYSSDTLLEMSAEQSKDPDYLLMAHGFTPDAWELLTARNSVWNVYSKGEDGHDVSTLYASKITVKPRDAAFDLAAVIEAVRDVEPVKVPNIVTEPAPGLLEIAYFDAHFGIATLDDYRPTLADTVAAIEATPRAEVVLAVGSDLFHHDNFRSQTAKGTVVEEIDFPRAWADAYAFYGAIITAALRQAETVYLYYVKGNHDESMAWAFCHLLAATYPQLVSDLSVTERKVHTYGGVAIGWTHGEKSVKDFDRAFLAEFPAFATATVKEIHTGHTHHEVVKDRFGVVVRTMPTGNILDQWHRDQGYVGSMRRFQLFEYAADRLRAIYYV